MSNQPIVLITGCSSGGIGKIHEKMYDNKKGLTYIGYSLAKVFAKEGNKVIATARRVEAMDGLEGVFTMHKFVYDILIYCRVWL
jgi:NADP-dependent 3-hydroxy acid dehydrogenase YdfG